MLVTPVVQRSGRDFRLLFAATAVNNTGIEISYIAFPLAAVLALHASPGQVGLLGTASTLAFLVIGLPAGVWVDRLDRRRLLVAADLVRFGLLASVPVAWWLGRLTMSQLIVVTLLIGVCRVFFDVGAQSYLPRIVGRENLIAANAQLAGVNSVARIAGRSLGGFLAGLFSGPVAIGLNALSSLWSAGCVSLVRHREPPPAGDRPKAHLGREVLEGLRYVARHPVLRAVALSSGTSNLFVSIVLVMLPVLFVNELGMSAGEIGLFFAAGGVGAVLGNVAGPRLARWLGYGPTLWTVSACIVPVYLLLPLAGRGPWLWVAGGVYLLMNTKSGVDNVILVSFRQRVTPDRLLGRMTATMRFVLWGMLPLGSAVAAAIGQYASVRAALWVGVVGMAFSWIPVVASPLRTMRDLPPPAE